MGDPVDDILVATVVATTSMILKEVVPVLELENVDEIVGIEGAALLASP